MSTRTSASGNDTAEPLSTHSRETADQQHQLGKAPGTPKEPSVFLKGIATTTLSAATVPMGTTAVLSMTRKTKAKATGNDDKAPNATEAAKTTGTLAGPVVTAAAVKADDVTAATTAKARGKENVAKAPAGANLHQGNPIAPLVASLCKASVKRVQVVTTTTRRHAAGGKPAIARIIRTPASTSIKNNHNGTVRCHATPLPALVVTAIDRHPDLHGHPSVFRGAQAPTNRLLVPAHRAAHASQYEKTSGRDAPKEPILLTQRRRKKRNARNTVENANHDHRLMLSQHALPDQNTEGMLAEPSFT